MNTEGTEILQEKEAVWVAMNLFLDGHLQVIIILGEGAFPESIQVGVG